MEIFSKDQDYEAFERVLAQAVEKYEMRLISYCLMPNHWHLVVWPHLDKQLYWLADAHAHTALACPSALHG